MHKKELYTALSRTTKFEYIQLGKTMLLKSYCNRKLPELELVNSKHNSLFKNGKFMRFHLIMNLFMSAAHVTY